MLTLLFTFHPPADFCSQSPNLSVSRSPGFPVARTPGLSDSRSPDLSVSWSLGLPVSRSPAIPLSRYPGLPISQSLDLPISRSLDISIYRISVYLLSVLSSLFASHLQRICSSNTYDIHMLFLCDSYVIHMLLRRQQNDVIKFITHSQCTQLFI